MLVAPEPALAARVREFLAEAGYTEAGTRAALGSTGPPRPGHRNLALFLHRTAEASTLNTLLRWFRGGLALPSARVEATIPGWFRDFAAGHGLLARDGDAWHSQCVLLPRRQCWIAADRVHWGTGNTAADYVPAPGPSADVLLSGTLPLGPGRTLDLGTGCGIQAFGAAARGGSIVATDINPRALVFARFSAGLNGLDNLELRQGDAYAPVVDERFDHIVCNPPFVMSPGSTFIYRDNPLLLDGFVRELARGATPHLVEGGYFQMVCEWAELEGEPWRERLAAWFDGRGCDTWVLHGASHDAADYALMRTHELDFATPEAEVAHFDEWMAHYREQRLHAVHGGLITLRRRSGVNWLRMDETPETGDQSFGAALLAGFAARDFIDRRSADGSLPGARLRLSPGLRLQVSHHPGEDGWTIDAIEARVANGLGPRTRMDSVGVEFLRQFDGKQTVEQVIAALARRLGREPAAIRDESMKQVLALLEHGFVEPA